MCAQALPIAAYLPSTLATQMDRPFTRNSTASPQTGRSALLQIRTNSGIQVNIELPERHVHWAFPPLKNQVRNALPGDTLCSFMDNHVAKWRVVTGWIAVSTSTIVACFWAFWGSIENFHEGWFYPSIWRNIGLMFVQFLSPMLIIMAASAAVTRWPKLALPGLGAAAVAAALFFRGAGAAIGWIVIPLALLAVLYHFGRPEPRRWALRCLILLPTLTAIVCGAYPGWRAVHRLDDGNYGLRVVEGNGVTLAWAPEGPGWPSHHASWDDARHACAHLTPDGRSLATTPQNHWRLPTVEEAVRSMVYRGRNAGGTWDESHHRPQYRVMPEKDSPLWRAHSQIIYWWTDTESAPGKAYRIAYNGYVTSARKEGWGDYWAFRCVCEPSKVEIPTRR